MKNGSQQGAQPPPDFRGTYRQLTEQERESLRDVKRYAEVLAERIEKSVPLGRERAIAYTKLEEAVMWAVKGITG